MTDSMIAENDKTGTMQSDADAPKKRGKRITKKDWEKIASHLKEELESRKRNEYRRQSERRWREVDRQIAMEAMNKVNKDGSKIDDTWHNVIELGELSKSSENMCADVRRIIFPHSKFWFEAHADLTPAVPFNEQGEKKVHDKAQQLADGRVRAFMTQQHTDFGLEDRVELSTKEAFHHGSFVAEVEWEEMDMIFEGTKRKTVAAPVWIPHSMWNCYPDPSPSVIGASMFYTGSMFIESYLPRYKCEKLVKESKDDGWMQSQWKKVPKDEHQQGKEHIKDVRITTYWGDISIDRSDESLYYPDHKAILFNDVIVYMAPNDSPYKRLIFRGYERNDVRNPYYTSPIIKMSPQQKLASTLANKFVDGIELKLEPPLVYDGNDPDFVMNGGPEISPGAKRSTKGSASFQLLEVGDPAAALTGLQFFIQEMKEKLGRPGKDVGDRATKAEVVKNAQDQEVSIVDFIGKMELGLRSFLYMQHDMNREKLTEYSFFSPEMQDPDFIRITKKDLPKAIHFEVVGARGVLGEQERNEKMSVTTAFLAGNPLFAPLLDVKEIALQMYMDAGIKNADRFLKQDGKESPEQLKAAIQQMQQKMQELAAEYEKEKSHNDVKMAKIKSDHETKTGKTAADYDIAEKKMQLEYQAKSEKLMEDFKKEIISIAQKHQQHLNERDARVDGIVQGKLPDVEKAESGAILKAIQELADGIKDIKTEVEGVAQEVADVANYQRATKTVERDAQGNPTAIVVDGYGSRKVTTDEAGNVQSLQ